MLLFIKFLSYILVSYGISNIIVYSNGPFHVFERWRNFAHSIGEQFGELFTCMLCMSTWIGLMLSIINVFIIPSVAFTPFNIIFGVGNCTWLAVILDMGFTSAVVWLLHQFEEMMERSNSYTEGELYGDGSGQSILGD